MPEINLLVIVRIVLLALFLWGGYIALLKAVYRQDAHAINIAWPAIAFTLFAWSMGWLS